MTTGTFNVSYNGQFLFYVYSATAEQAKQKAIRFITVTWNRQCNPNLLHVEPC